MTLLDRVIADAGADSAAKEDALSQKTQIVRRMETEAQMTAVLEGMGAENALAVCGAQGVTLLIPQEMGMDETARNRLLNAVGGQSGIEMTQLKIILIEKISKLELYTDEKSAILMNIHREVFLN